MDIEGKEEKKEGRKEGRKEGKTIVGRKEGRKKEHSCSDLVIFTKTEVGDMCHLLYILRPCFSLLNPNRCFAKKEAYVATAWPSVSFPSLNRSMDSCVESMREVVPER
jgi:hypothetical protein